MRRFGKLRRLLNDRTFRRGVLYGVAAAIEHEPLLRLLSCRTLVDVGANKGQFALVALAVWPRAQVFSFEPLERPASIFKKVLGREPNVQLFETAIGSSAFEANMHVSRREDSSSLLPITERQSTIFPGTEEKETRTVPVRRLDDLLNGESLVAPAMLKIDVQGFEGEVLHGCQALLDHFAYVYVECSFEELYSGQVLASEVIDFLHKAGFALQGVYNVSYAPSGKAIQGDFFFARGQE